MHERKPTRRESKTRQEALERKKKKRRRGKKKEAWVFLQSFRALCDVMEKTKERNTQDKTNETRERKEEGS